MEEIRPKVLALYQAVLDLLDEGADIHSMKVSDMTERAGIGKGTAYDYFKSKEEIIASALIFDMENKIKEEKEKLDQMGGFSERIHYVFDWIIQHFQEQKAFARFLRLTTQPYEVSRTLLNELQKQKSGTYCPMTVLNELCTKGKEEGAIREEIPVSAARIVMVSKLAAFVLYLEDKEKAPDVEPEWMRDFLCRSLLEELRMEPRA